MSKKSNIGIIIVKTIKVIFCLPFLLFGIFIFYKVLWPQIQEMPNIKWPDFLIISIFCIVFTGVGFVMPLLAVFRKEKEKPQIEPVTSTKITHQDLIEINKDWGDNAISNDNIGHKIMIVFALVWNVIAYSISFAVLSEALPKRDYKAMLVLLFPAVGLILIFMAIKFYLQKVRFGNSEFIMDPFPGCIGGEVAGYIDLNIPFRDAKMIQASLLNIRRYTSGSGKNRSTKEDVIWENSGIVEIERSRSGQTRAYIRFQVPNEEEISPSEKVSDNYKLWRLCLFADIPGIDLDSKYIIPVFHGDAISSLACQHTNKTEETQKMATQAVQKVLRIHRQGQEYFWHLPFGRHIAAGIFLTIFGAIFFGAGIFLFTQGGIVTWVMAPIFSLIGFITLLAGIQTVGDHKKIVILKGKVSIFQKYYGLPMGKKEIPFEQIKDVKVKKSSTQMNNEKNGKTQTTYDIFVLTQDKKKHIILDTIYSQEEANIAIETINQIILE